KEDTPEKKEATPEKKEATPKKKETTIKKSIKKMKLAIQEEGQINNDITGMSIADPNPFLKALRVKDPTLFVTEDDGKYGAYSRLCPWNKRRHPVILTDEEKEKIDKENPGSYDQAMKYGSNPNKQFWYICPRYWDLKRNVSLTKAQADSGKYGGIIPQKINGKSVKKVPAGANIWEFTEPKDHVDKDGNYIKYNPGFLKDDAHPDGLCVPCCFKAWDGISQKKRRAKCNQNKEEGEIDDIPNQSSKQELDEYIKGPDKFPLQEGRFGYLPMQIQRFLMVDNKSCQISSTNTNLKKNKPCYLRKGVESSKGASFLGCIADVYSEVNNDKTLSIDAFIQEKILPILTIDNFVKYQNGNLVNDFQSKDTSDINIDDATGTKIYTLLHKNNKNQLKKIISAHNNFKLFLQSQSTVLDYKYMWDLICDNNESLFSSGVNLIILELPQDDITSNVNIICPSNFYSNNKFDSNKNTIILMKKYEYFEPIYIVTDKSKTTITSFATLKMYTPELFKKLPNLKLLSDTIRDIYSSMCKPLPSILNIADKYNFREIKFVQNNTLERTIEILNEYNIDIQETVINYDNKVIGIIISSNDKTGFVPCFPSGIIMDYDIIIMDDINKYLMKFEDTVDFLQNVSKRTDKKILCLPVVKILEDELIVGLLTQTNQFVELKEPEQDNDMSLKYTIKDENYYSVNNTTQNNNNYDESRLDYIKKIKLETSLFNEFRNKLKMLLSKFDNKIIRDEIENISNSKYVIYYSQMEKLIKLIKTLMKDDVEFVNVIQDKLSIIENALDKKELLLIPKKNLMSDLDNEDIYYSKISDELIRYNRIKNFMFEPKMFLNFNNLKYDLNNNEIILLQSLLTQDYFDDLVPINESNYVSFNSYDTVQPNITQKYNNEYVTKENKNKSILDKTKLPNIDEEDQDSREKKPFKIYSKCPTEIKSIFSQLKLKFSGGFKEIEFSNETSMCSFDVILTIVNNYTSDNSSIEVLKKILLEEYEKLYNLFPENILNIIDIYGKPGDSNGLRDSRLSIKDIIMSEEYNMNNIDILIISNKYNIPITLIAPRMFKENNNEYMSLNVEQSMYIIRTPGFHKYKQKPAKYKLLLKNKDSFIDIDTITNKNTRTNILKSNVELMDIIKSFTADKSTE
ncbi:hypothetical protein N8261_04830, partial [Flavobacteriaceae bacterium]|nr:hypothetical protein [Flavobacteriaceae bacterium]